MANNKKNPPADTARPTNKGQKQQTSAGYDQTPREEEMNTKNRKQTTSGPNQSPQQNDGRSSGK